MIRTTVLALFMTLSGLALAADAQHKPDLENAKKIAETVCIACHGVDGNSQTSAYPILAGQGSDYLFKQLKEFKATETQPAVRINAVMAGMAGTLSLNDMKDMAAYFSQQKPKLTLAKDAGQRKLGEALWRKGDFERGVPACAGCHGPTGAGLPALYPRLSGQYAEYTDLQLKSFRSEERANDADKPMRTIADKLSDKQIKALADYIAGLH